MKLWIELLRIILKALGGSSLKKPEKLETPAAFGKRSLERLETCHEDLQEIAHELIKYMDVTVLCGHRGEREQNSAFNSGHSRLMFPRSKHNKTPSRAVDLAPYQGNVPGGVDWKDIGRFKKMVELVEMIAKEKKIKIRLGRDFSFKDWPHVELHDKHKGNK